MNADNVYNEDATAAAVLTSLYAQMSLGPTNTCLSSLSLLPALSADELVLYGGASSNYPTYIPYYMNKLNNSLDIDYTSFIYPTIFTLNSAIDGLDKSSRLTPAVKQQLLGEAKFMRALCYFYLVNLYGDIPMPLNTDYTQNGTITKTPRADVYKQIINDLLTAENLLSDKYLDGSALAITTERIRPNRWAAIALLSRVYLYVEDWKNAEKEATKVINNTALFNLTSINDAFLSNNSEAIWQLQPVSFPAYTTNAPEAKLFVLPDSVGPNSTNGFPVYLSTNVVNAFEHDDLRKSNWVDSTVVKTTFNTYITYYYPYKYKVIEPDAPITEYSVVLRLSEQYLIRAEARAEQSNIAESIDDLNYIRHRAGLNNTEARTKNQLLDAIMHERQVELFTEWGHRWFDLKRTHRIDSTMNIVAVQKGTVWNNTAQLYPFNLIDLTRDPNLVQNPGY